MNRTVRIGVGVALLVAAVPTLAAAQPGVSETGIGAVQGRMAGVSTATPIDAFDRNPAAIGHLGHNQVSIRGPFVYPDSPLLPSRERLDGTVITRSDNRFPQVPGIGAVSKMKQDSPVSFSLGLLTGQGLMLMFNERASAQPAVQAETAPLIVNTVAEADVLDGGGNAFPLFGSLLEGDHGLTLAPVYIGEVFTNTRGGRSTRQATRYLGLLDLQLTLDFEKVGLGVPGRFVVLGQTTHGQGLTKRFVGDTLFISNIDPINNLNQVSEYWWELGLLEDSVSIRLGKQDVNTEFLLIETAADFIHSTFGLSPSTAFPTYPHQSMAGVVMANFTDSWSGRIGVWDAFSTGGNWGFSGNDSVLVIGELEYSYTLANGVLPGKLTIGAAYESAGVLSGESISSVQQYFVQIEQALYQERRYDRGDNQGLAVFAGYYPRFPGLLVTTESVGDSLVTGLVYTGLIPGRDEDVIGAGVAWAELYQGGTGQEAVFECFYQARVTPRVTLQPDLIYVASPSGIYRDALVAGLRFVMTW